MNHVKHIHSLISNYYVIGKDVGYKKIIYIYIILQPLRGGGLRIKDLSEAERERRMHILRLFLKSYLKFQKHFEVPSSLELMIKDGLTSTREDAA